MNDWSSGVGAPFAISGGKRFRVRVRVRIGLVLGFKLGLEYFG